MQSLDDGLKKFKCLVVLILTGNFLQEIPGGLLPRNLRFLELYANEISQLRSLVKKAPQRILHIGLGRNKLSQGICAFFKFAFSNANSKNFLSYVFESLRCLRN